jgi:hypothetical protein
MRIFCLVAIAGVNFHSLFLIHQCQMRCSFNSTACTFLGPSRKRGPPKGYIDAIEARLHQTEALLGIMLATSDPRAHSLLRDMEKVNECFHMSFFFLFIGRNIRMCGSYLLSSFHENIFSYFIYLFS